VEERGHLLTVLAAIVVLAMLLPSVAGTPGVHRGMAPTPTRSAVVSAAEVTFPVGAYPFGIAYNPVNGLLYVTNFGSSNISVVNTTTNRVVAWIPMPFGIETLAVDTSTGMVYTAEAVSTVYAINSSTNRVEWNIPLLTSGCPYGCAPHVQTYDPSNGDIYVTDLTSDNVTVIHGNLPVATVRGENAPNGAAYDVANGEVYVANEGSLALTVINGTTNIVVGQVAPVGSGPGMTFDNLNGEVYVCENAGGPGQSNSVTAVNGSSNQVIASIPIGSACGAAVYDPVNNYVYITDRFKVGVDLSNVTVVDPNTHRIVLTLPVQQGPIGIAYDSVNHNVYVTDSDTNNISILPQIYRLTVHETGLAAGTNWSATVGATTFSSTTPTITFPETNGTFDFTIGNVTNLSANPSSGTVTVTNGPRDLNVTFSKGGGSGLFGLPGATGYYVLGGFVALLVAATAVVVVLTRRKHRSMPPAGSPRTGDTSGPGRY
jgi:YVTN family beta-propeller protein